MCQATFIVTAERGTSQDRRRSEIRRLLVSAAMLGMIMVGPHPAHAGDLEFRLSANPKEGLKSMSVSVPWKKDLYEDPGLATQTFPISSPIPLDFSNDGPFEFQGSASAEWPGVSLSINLLLRPGVLGPVRLRFERVPEEEDYDPISLAHQVKERCSKVPSTEDSGQDTYNSCRRLFEIYQKNGDEHTTAVKGWFDASLYLATLETGIYGRDKVAEDLGAALDEAVSNDRALLQRYKRAGMSLGHFRIAVKQLDENELGWKAKIYKLFFDQQQYGAAKVALTSLADAFDEVAVGRQPGEAINGISRKWIDEATTVVDARLSQQ